MRYLFVIICLLSLTIGHGQKTKKTTKKPSASNKTALAKLDDLIIESSRKKDDVRFYVLFGTDKKKDTLQLKLIDVSENGKDALTKDNNIPTDCTIVPVNITGAKLYAIAWIEKLNSEVPDKKEEVTKTITQIWNIADRKQAFENIQTSTHITEIVYLDKFKGASKTTEKKRGEGFAVTILENGDIIQVGKNQQNKLTYDPTEGKYVSAKLPVQPDKPVKAQPKRR